MKKQIAHLRHLGWIGILIVLAVSISACNKSSRSIAPTASVPNTRLALSISAASPAYTLAASPSRTPAKTPTPTRTASPTSTVTPSLTPKPTRTLIPSPTITRWVVTDIPLVEETPTSIPTASDRASAYQLKAWDGAAALELVETAEQFSFADNIPMPPGILLFNFRDDQDVVRLAAKEALHRFPEAGFQEKLEWRIALADTIQDSSKSDAWILQQMEDGLNSGQVAPDSLDRLLNPFGFQISQRESAPNLFDDGKPAQVIWITRQDRAYTGLYAALHQDDQGRYTLTKIHSTWNFNFGNDTSPSDETNIQDIDPIQVGDHTGDGLPEIILHPGFNENSYCGYDLLIYQWKTDRFVDTSRGQFTLRECSIRLDSWKYGEPGEIGAESIEIWRAISGDSWVTRYELYEWNGMFYELSESQLEPPEIFKRDGDNWIVIAMHEGDYATIIEKVQQYLADETQRKEMVTDIGPSYPDYLRFQLGLAYAFQSDVGQARAAFEQIVREPYNPLTTTVSKAAQAYLDNYTGDADLYRACQAALKVMEKASGEHPFGKNTADFTHLKQIWGYGPSWSWDSIALCNLDTAFQHVSARLDSAKFAIAPALLTRVGVSIRASAEIDLNQDGQDEWLLLVNTPGDDVPVNLWVLLNTAQGIGTTQSVGTTQGVVALPVVPWNLKSYNLPLENAYAAGLSVKTVVSPEGFTLDFIRSGEFLYTIQFDTTGPSIKWPLWPEDALVTYSVYPVDGGLELDVTRNTYYCKYCTDTYRWVDQSFQLYDPKEKLAGEAEAALLDRWQPDEAIPLLIKISRDTTYPDRPRMLYLLGLSYELAGDEVHAVQTYWKLWREIPESAYARLAQAKLEFRK